MKIAVLGYGTIGSGVVEVVRTNAESIAARAGEEVEVKYVLDLRDFPGDPVQEILVHDYNVIAEDEEIGVIVETMGGTKPAYDFVKTALLKGKSVCSSNKELVAAHGAELIQIAKDKNVNFFFEASVGGGIPIIRPLNQCITADEIQEINGILNGTTNFILTKMADEGADFAEVLIKAQELGYAEKDPTADVEGYDACRKIAILSSLMSGRNVHYEDIYTEGITKISSADFKYAKQMNKSIKLLALSRDTEDGFFAMVAPFLISREHPLYSVNGVFNAVYVHGNMLGDSMYYGRGAGKLPTASAVVSDVVDCARHQGKTIMCFWDEEKVEVADIKSARRKFFVRVSADKRDAAMGAFGALAEVNVGLTEEFAFMTQEMSEAEFDEKIEKTGGCLNRIRIMA